MSKFNKHIVIVGSARSGTSWLSESMAQAFRYRMLFEPDHAINVPGAKVLADVFLDRNKEYPEVAMFLNKVFKNRIDSDWIAQNSNRKFKMHLWPFVPKKYIIKLIRSNLAANYISTHFELPIIYLVRNPYDVVASQNRVKFPWLYDLSEFQNQEDLVDKVEEISGINIGIEHFSRIEILAIRWCIENVILLKYESPTNKKIKIVKYEDLKGNFELYKSICMEFNIELAPDMEKLYVKPSTKTHPKSSIINGLSSNGLISEEEKTQIKSILTAFKVDFYKI